MDLDSSQTGTVITFYSYKGGTGRSMALANAACLLAQLLKGPSQRVLVLDWDLEAPGLHRFFTPRSEDSENINRPGVLDYFYALRQLLEEKRALSEKLASPNGHMVLDKELPLDDYVIPDVLPVVPGIDLMKAGRLRDPHYAELVSTFDWVDFYERFGSAVGAFRQLLASRYAFCLIDSRTGVSDISGICTMLLPEKLVAVFTPNRQSLYGLLDLVKQAVEYRRGSDDLRPLAVFPLPSRIDDAEMVLRRQWREEYQRAFEGLFREVYEVAECDLSSYFAEVVLPHESYYAYGEEIAVLSQEMADVRSLKSRYEEFTSYLVERDFAWEIPREPEARPPRDVATPTHEVIKASEELERRVADAYRAMGAEKVQRNIELAGNRIDVYAELETADRGVYRVVVEAKEWIQPVTVDVVFGFSQIVNRLRRERLVDEGIIVSSSGFDQQAREVAQTGDIRLLEPADMDAMVARTLTSSFNQAARDRLRGELHEALNVLHAGVMLEAEASQYWLQQGEYGRVESALGKLGRVARFTYDQLANILDGLRDPVLEEQGLVAALEHFVNAISPQHARIRSDFKGRLSSDYEHALYRIAQGAISNSLRHAGILDRDDGAVWVIMEERARNLTLRIEDNGIGFDVSQVRPGDTATFGLEGMRHWATSIGAELLISSTPSQGTRVSVTVPIEERAGP